MNICYCIEVPPPLRHHYSDDYLYFGSKEQFKECQRFLINELKSMGFDDAVEDNDWERNYQETREQEHQEDNHA